MLDHAKSLDQPDKQEHEQQIRRKIIEQQEGRVSGQFPAYINLVEFSHCTRKEMSSDTENGHYAEQR